MEKKTKWIIWLIGIWILWCLFSVLVIRRHMSLLPRMFSYSRLTGKTDLHWAVWDGRTRAVKKLLEKGADVNCRTKDGETPLHIAAFVFGGNKKIVELLIANGADVNAKDYLHGSTPLHDAAWSGNAEIVKLLIDAGANVNAKMNNDRTPLDSATAVQMFPRFHPFRIFADKKSKACAELLRAHGAESNVRSYPYSSGDSTVVFFTGSLGMLLFLTGYIWFMVIAFKEDAFWGFLCLLVPFVAPVFLIQNWDKCKTPFITSMAGGAISFIGIFLGPLF